MISISYIDHLVITVKDIPTTIEFYARVLGMQVIAYVQACNIEIIEGLVERAGATGKLLSLCSEGIDC